MKVLHVIHDLTVGGAEKLVADMLKASKNTADSIQMNLLILGKTGSKAVLELKTLGVNVFSLDSNNFYSPILVLKMYRFLKKNSYDIVHVHLFPSLYFVSLATRFIAHRPKLIYTEHSTYNTRRKYTLFRKLDQINYASYDAIVAISNSVKDSLVSWIGHSFASKIFVVRNAINLAQFEQASPYARKDLVSKEPIEASYLLLMVARFTPAKDHATVLRALKKLKEEGIHCTLLLVGDGPTACEVEKMVQELSLQENVCFLGDRQDVPAIMKTVDICLLSSHWEGFGLVAVEYMAAGRPVIATNVGGLKEVMADYGFLFEHENEDQLVGYIKQLITDSDTYKAQCAKGLSISKKYDFNKFYTEHISLYRRLVNEK